MKYMCHVRWQQKLKTKCEKFRTPPSLFCCISFYFVICLLRKAFCRFLAPDGREGTLLFFTAIADNDNMHNEGLGGHTCETLKEKRETALFPTASGHDSQV